MLLVAIVLSSFSACCFVNVFADETAGPITTSDDEKLVDFDRLGRLLETLDYHLQDFQKRTCRLSLHSHNCVFVNMEKLKNVGNFLRSGNSPGKRDDGEQDEGIQELEVSSDEIRAANAVLEDLVEQRRAIATLKLLLSSMKKDLDNMHTKKRDCRFRLGGHCLTESLDRAANQFYYLKSANSPGRRRRQVDN